MYTRTESDIPTENGTVRSIQFTDLEDPDYMFFYIEGDEEAIRYEIDHPPIEDEVWFRIEAGQFENMLEEAELTHAGEKEVESWQTDQIDIEEALVNTTRWFDQDSGFEVRMEADDELEAELEDEEGEETSEEIDVDTSYTVIDFEIDPDMDESLFELDDMDYEEGEMEDMTERLTDAAEE